LWINRTRAQWREVDKLADNYPLWQTVYYHFRQFKLRGVWEEVLDKLVVKERGRQQREATPRLLAIDSQSVKIIQFITQETGIDAHKLINGRKRSIAVDRLGLPWSLAVTSANTSDNEAGRLVIDRLKGKVPRLKLIAADHGYKVSFIAHVAAAGYQTEIVRGRPVKSQKVAGALCPRKTVGRSSEVWAAVPRRDSISGRSAGADGSSRMWKKQWRVRKRCCKLLSSHS
jgi:putative transposase